MSKQLNLLSSGKVIATALHTEMEQSYLEYAMSVIVGRALPDVRDGLKPVHRRILYAMHELGLTPDRPYRKCARVVGDVLGKYHPHGDQAVYDALVRLVQDFSSRYPLLAGHGNFGSVDNDPPAAMRYTETRLSPIGNQSLLAEIGESTVDFAANFDNSQQEPTVLPAQLPTLLLNGCSGIAVGMATNIPPHNLGEIVDALVALIDSPDLSLEKLMALVPGPDFPTGGEIVGNQGIIDAYTNGRGSITVRAVTSIEEIQPGRGRHRRPVIIVTELPYQVNKAGCIEKIATLINQGRIEGIADLRDESDREGMRIVIELKREAQPPIVLEQLYRLTPLQSNFGVIMLALVNGVPLQLSLKEVLQEFLDFREQTLTRRYQNQLEQAQSRQHLVEGLIKSLDHLDDLIDILRHAPDGTTAKVQLQSQFQLSERQSDAILAMPMRRLTGLEQQNLRQEFEDLAQEIGDLERLLENRHELLKALKKDLRALKKQYSDQRRTVIHAAEAKTEILAAPVSDEPVIVELNQRGYARCLRSSKRKKGADLPAELTEISVDLTIFRQTAELSTDLLLFTGGGKAYGVGLQSIPFTSSKGKGKPLVTLLPDSGRGDQVVARFLSTEITETSQLILLSQQGKIKRLPMSEFAEMTSRGLGAAKIKSGDQLGWVVKAEQETNVAIATSSGRLLNIPITEIPEMGRTAQGNQVFRLRKQESIVGLAAVRDDEDLLLISSKGYCKRLPIDLLRLGKVGDLGTQAMQFMIKSDGLIALLPASTNQDVIVLSNQDRAARMNIETLPMWGQDGPGTQLLKTKRGELLECAIAIPNPDVASEET
ncbi:DNA topoisomerase (ATP-hydrolyzing) subunit A [Acaryochloris sp. IP29b_bin.148]|uniref:DNA topoisomerase (ATP-hydrolyzing) subunit A n=1 Tax=Acaryochloris sp. IP29b_bin.148 TaxID=2969218 RepID=UPI00262F3B79|nr:DNA topoisomerase (ATP-hydrolyzing) subunit A [Acaryochloris sp. IP29b_bin.148]